MNEFKKNKKIFFLLFYCTIIHLFKYLQKSKMHTHRKKIKLIENYSKFIDRK